MTGVVAAIAFDQLFEIFHTLFFPAGSFTFVKELAPLVLLKAPAATAARRIQRG